MNVCTAYPRGHGCMASALGLLDVRPDSHVHDSNVHVNTKPGLCAAVHLENQACIQDRLLYRIGFSPYKTHYGYSVVYVCSVCSRISNQPGTPIPAWHNPCPGSVPGYIHARLLYIRGYWDSLIDGPNRVTSTHK